MQLHCDQQYPLLTSSTAPAKVLRYLSESSKRVLRSLMLSANPHYRFGDFIVDTEQKVLLRQDKAVPLTPKLFETLLILVENSGRIVQKEQFMERLWPHTFVEEANLTSNIRQLRKSLGDNARKPHYIETVTKRGYRFIANVQRVETVTKSVVDSAIRLETSPTALPAMT